MNNASVLGVALIELASGALAQAGDAVWSIEGRALSADSCPIVENSAEPLFNGLALGKVTAR